LRTVLSVIVFLFLYSMNGDPTNSENTAFRNIKVDGSNGNYHIIGEVRQKNGFMYYSVEDGHIEYISERSIKMKRSEGWQNFKIDIHIPKLPKNGSLLLILYNRNSQNQLLEEYPVIIDRF
jgi:hypothetical protein